MKYYLAPLEGITTTIYRNAYHKYYTPLDKYFTPFLCPHSKKGFATKEKKEISPENNPGYHLVPQILSNHAEDCLDTIRKLKEFGYEEINLNFGCPSKTVVSKGRGSGFLAKPDELNAFLDAVISKAGIKVSVKTRIGKNEADEFYRLLEIYNQYPLEELIIHPRRQVDYYKNHPDMEIFEYAIKESKNPLCYNGDLFEAADIKAFEEKYPQIRTVMLGRGIIRNPGLVEEYKTSCGLNMKKFRLFHDEVYRSYIETNCGEVPVLFKMKELWAFMGLTFPEMEKHIKKIKKCSKLVIYDQLIEEFFALLS